MRFETGPLDLKLGVNGYTFMAPKVLTSWEGYALNVDAERQGDGSGRLWVFDRWSDGRAKAHTIKTPDNPTTYTASFRRVCSPFWCTLQLAMVGIYLYSA